MDSWVPRDNVVVVGAGLAGLLTVEQLRAQGYTGAITMVGKEQENPYDRPPLSKQVLAGTWEVERARLRTAEELEALDVDLRLGVEATGLGVWTVSLSDGSVLRTDATVLATGAVPRTLPGQPDGVSTLRTLADAAALKERLDTIGSLLIVGGGFIAAEVATAARARGVEVTVVETLDAPCQRVLGPAGAGLVARLMAEAGVTLHTGAKVDRFINERTVDLAGSDGRPRPGQPVSADHILVSVGSLPDVAWLEGSELPLGEGILAGGTGRVPPLPEVWALGDATSWWDQPRRGYARNEHWTGTGDQAAMVAADILRNETPEMPPPYVWSDQFGLKIQLLGRTDIADEVVALEGDGLAGGAVMGTVLGYRRQGNLVAVVAFGAPARFARHRDDVIEGTKAITTVAVEIAD